MMKKILFSLMLTCAAGTAHADDYTYPYLVLVGNDGSQTSLAVNQLELTFSDGQLVAKNADGTQSFTLSQLRKMAFSDSPGVVDAINTIDAQSANDCPADIYTVSGIHAGTFEHIGDAQAALPKGIYIVKQKGQTYKISVK